MNNKIIIAGLFILALSVVSWLLLFLVSREHRKQLREMLDKTRTDWAKAFDSADALREKEASALKYALSVKDDLIAEKDKRIEQLEADIAMKDMVMACAKIDGSIDYEELRKRFQSGDCGFWTTIENTGV